MGRAHLIVGGLLCFLMASTASAETDEGKEIGMATVSATVNYGSWSSSGGDNKGTQTLGYLQAAYDRANWGLAVTGKGAQTSYLTVLSDERLEFTTLTDTVVSTYYSHKTGGLTLRGGVDASFPTGKHSYTSAEMGRIIIDPLSQDLMMINTYGAGTTITPHFLIVDKLSDSFTIGGGLRYEFTGSYDPISDVENDTLDPGDRLLIMLNGAYIVTDNDYLMFTVMYNRATVDKQSGVDIFRTGDMYTVEGRYIRKWDEAFNSIFSVTYRQQEKNEMLDSGDVLNSELSNANNNSWEVYANNIYRYSDDFSFTGLVGYKQVMPNGYSQGDALYDGGRWKVYAEPGMMWFLSQTNYISLKLRYSYIFDKKDAFSSDDSGYNVYNIDLGYTLSF